MRRILIICASCCMVAIRQPLVVASDGNPGLDGVTSSFRGKTGSHLHLSFGFDPCTLAGRMVGMARALRIGIPDRHSEVLSRNNNRQTYIPCTSALRGDGFRLAVTVDDAGGREEFDFLHIRGDVILQEWTHAIGIGQRPTGLFEYALAERGGLHDPSCPEGITLLTFRRECCKITVDGTDLLFIGLREARGGLRL